MKRTVSLIPLFIVLVLCLACSAANKDSLADGTLTIGLNDEFLPFEYRNEQEELEGFDIDLAQALSEKLGVKLEIKTMDFEEVLNGLDEGEYEAVISGLSKTNEREEDYSLTEPYINNGLVIVTTTSNSNPAKHYSEISGGTVGVQTGTTAQDVADYLHDTVGQNVSVKIYDDSSDLFEALKKGEINYVLTDVGVAAYMINQNPDSFVVSSEDVLTNEPLVIAVSSDNKALTEKLNQALEELKADGTLKALSEKWFNTDQTTTIDSEVRTIEENPNP